MLLAFRSTLSFPRIGEDLVHSIVLLSRRPRLYTAASDWDLPDVELYLYDSPSEALAKISLGKTAVFVFDSREFFLQHQEVLVSL